ncbi:MAG: pilus assembly protein [Actinomycetota bacterium]|nr:pilus assembly protein [Actinomycetota bacterium]
MTSSAKRPCRVDSGDEGTAMVEFTYLAILLMIPLVYLLLTVFQVQSAAFGVTEAARQAGRAYVTATDPAQGRQRADLAVRLALHDQGLGDARPPLIDCPEPSPCLTPGTRVRVTVTYRVRLLFLGAFFASSTAPAIPVTATHEQVVDRFRPAP